MLRLFMTLHSHAAHTLFMRCSYSLPNGLGAALVWFFQSSMESCSLIARSAICGLLISCSWTAHKLLIKRLCAEDWLAYGRDLVVAIHIDCISVCIRSCFSIYMLFISCSYSLHILLQTGGSCCLMCNGLNFLSIEYGTLHFDAGSTAHGLSRDSNENFPSSGNQFSIFSFSLLLAIPSTSTCRFPLGITIRSE